MLTIAGEVTWQRDPETGEWKIRPAEQKQNAKPNGAAQLDQSQIESHPILGLKRLDRSFKVRRVTLRRSKTASSL